MRLNRWSHSLDTETTRRDAPDAMDIFDMLFPTRCVACSEFGPVLCQRCFLSLHPIRRAFYGIEVTALGAYDGALRRAVLAMKSGRRDLITAFATRLSRLVLPGEVLCGVPTTAARRGRRGFDGGLLLASEVAKCSSNRQIALLTTRTSQAQHGRTGAVRRQSRGRFTLRDADMLAQCVTLVDDVCTTGSTLRDCAQALVLGGHSVHRAITIAMVS